MIESTQHLRWEGNPEVENSLTAGVRTLIKRSRRMREINARVRRAQQDLKYSAPVRLLYAQIDSRDRLRAFEGRMALRRDYRRFHSRRLREDSPRDFADFLYCRLIELNRSGNPLFTRLADKYAVREYVSNRLGDGYLVRLLWHGIDPEKIPFDDLPESYIIKTNSGSGGHIKVTGTPDRAAIVAHMKSQLKRNHYRLSGFREFHYYAIPPRILIEELLEDGHLDGPLNYSFWCFGGTPSVIQVDNHVHNINPFYDTSWNKLDLRTRDKFREVEIARPRELPAMLEVVQELARGFDFVRVDVYLVRGHIYFGEMTFTPAGGHFRFRPEHWNREFGDLWRDALVAQANNTDHTIYTAPSN